MAVRLALAKLGAGSAGAEDGDAAGMPVYGTRVTINTGEQAIMLAIVLSHMYLRWALTCFVNLGQLSLRQQAAVCADSVWFMGVVTPYCQTQFGVFLTC